MMGVVAGGAVMDNSGYAIGVIPPRLIHAMVSHRPLSEEYIVEDMHERKALMYSLADAFIILPGGAWGGRWKSSWRPSPGINWDIILNPLAFWISIISSHHC